MVERGETDRRPDPYRVGDPGEVREGPEVLEEGPVGDVVFADPERVVPERLGEPCLRVQFLAMPGRRVLDRVFGEQYDAEREFVGHGVWYRPSP